MARKFQVPLEMVQVVLSLDKSEMNAIHAWMDRKRDVTVRVMMRQGTPEVYRSQGMLAQLEDFDSLLTSIRTALVKEGIDVT